ncbi:hypothetical protein MRX96_001598 [Rhipicephalus microplus]
MSRTVPRSTRRLRHWSSRSLVTSNTPSLVGSRPRTELDIQTETPEKVSSRVNTSVGENQVNNAENIPRSASNTDHCECGSKNAPLKSATKVTNVMESDNICSHVPGNNSNKRGKDGTQDNKGKSCLKCENSSSTTGKCGRGDSREKACLKCVADSTEGTEDKTQDERDKLYPKRATGSTTTERDDAQGNTSKACSKRSSESSVECEDGTRADGEFVGIKAASVSSAGIDSSEDSRNKTCSKCATNSASRDKKGTQDKAASTKHVKTLDRVSRVPFSHKDREISARNPDVSVESTTDSDVTMASVSDPDVTKQPTSNAEATGMPMSASLICLNCRSNLGIQVSGVATFRSAQATGAFNLPPFAQAPHGASTQPRGFSAAQPFSAPQASTGAEQERFMAGTPPFEPQVPLDIQLGNMPPSYQHHVPTNAWWPNSTQTPSLLETHGSAEGTQLSPSTSQAPSFTAHVTYNMQMQGYPLEPSMVAAPSPQARMPSAFLMRGAPTPGQQQPFTMAPPFLIGGFTQMPGQFQPPYQMGAPPRVQPPLNALMYEISVGRQPPYSWPSLSQSQWFSPRIWAGNVVGQPPSSMAPPQTPPGVGIPPSAHFRPGSF